MNAFHAAIIRDAILTGRLVNCGDMQAADVHFPRRRDTALWRRAYERTLANPGWEVREPAGNEEQHVVPVADLISHSPRDCACGPRTEAVPGSDGSIRWVVVHHSLDGREAHE